MPTFDLTIHSKVNFDKEERTEDKERRLDDDSDETASRTYLRGGFTHTIKDVSQVLLLERELSRQHRVS